MGKSSNPEKPHEYGPGKSEGGNEGKAEFRELESANNTKNTFFRIWQAVSLDGDKYGDAEGGTGTISRLMSLPQDERVCAYVLITSREDGKKYTISVDIDSLD